MPNLARGVGRRGRPRHTTLLIAGATRRRRLGAIGLIAALAVCLAVLLGGRAYGGQARTPTVYGADMARMQAAVNVAGWPQQVYNWCGVASLAAIADYRGAGVTQAGAAGYLNSPAATSVWGTPSFIYPGPGFTADIARDAGTDPRSLAVGLTGLAGGRYHALVDHWGAWDATIRLAADLKYSGQPITVFVDHGQHSVVVSQVYANDDPVSDPGSIYALEVWDPGFGSAFDAQIQNSQAAVVGIGDWLSWGIYWGLPYEQNGDWDPDPAVGPYTYDPSQGEWNHLWIGNWVYIQPWGPAVSADWAVDQQDLVIPGQHGELPPGYVLPTPTPVPGVRIARTAPTVVPPPATPVQRRSAAPVATDVAPTPPGEPVLVEAPAGASLCVGPYCLRDVNLWWLAMGGALALLALALGVGAIVAQRRATRRARTHITPPPLAAPSNFTIREVTDTSPLTLAEMAALEAPAPLPDVSAILKSPDTSADREAPTSGSVLAAVAPGEATTSDPAG